MYSNQSKGETHHVSKRVQQSKKEIEELKLELQKLINREESNSIGSNNLLDVNNVNEHVTLTPNLPMKYNSVYDVRTHSSRNKNDFLVKDVQECKVEEIKKKVRHYDIDETREYMRKQKEKRLLMKKSQTKESQNMVDLKKQKLKELQRKSLELVQKSIRQKREKPKSRENLTKLIPSKSIADMSVKDKLNKNISNCDNITIRCRDYDLDVIPTLQPIVTLPSLYNKEHHLAAVKIQAIFRCYRQRKLYKLILKAKKELEDKARNLAEESHKKNMKHVTMESEKKESVKRIESEKKDFMERIEFEKKDFVERIESEKKDSVDRIEFERVPSWLQPIIQPYPYNFITAVKQKLNIAVNTPPKTSDVAVQMSFSDICSQPQSPLEINRERIEEPIGKQSWKSFLSHGRLGLGLGEIKNTNDCDIKSILEKSKHSKSASPSRNVSDSDTSKDIPDLSSESIPKTKSNISDKISSNDLKINFERLKNLKLKNKNLENINNDLISKETQSKHFLQVPEVNSTVNSVVGHNRKLNGADNIIAHNRSNYSKSNSLRLNPSNKSDSGYNRRRDDSIIAFNIGDYSRSKSTPNISESKHMSPKSYDSVQRSLEQNNLKTVDSELRSKSLLVSNKSDFKSLLTTVPKTSESNDSTVDSEVKSQNSERYTSNFTSFALSATSVVPSLKHPSVTLNGHNCAPVRRSLKPGDVTTFETQQNTNQIHLKFEAELHLLNDFNESLQQIMAIEKSLLDLQTKNVNNTIYCHQDTQTSVSLHDDTNKSKVPPAMQNVRITEETKSLVTVRSYSRDSEIDQDFCELSLNDTSDKSFVTTGLEMSQINESISTTVDNSTFNVLDSGSFGGNVYAGLSLGMFDQLIKDEDARIENLKTILKIREKALLDRTKGELMWLEIQKKHLIETGQLQEASIIKKKQRGILIKLQHEKQEMLRLKQMQKSSSKERKTILKEQRNTIKAQLSNNNSSTRIKRNKQKQRHTGPIKVYNLHQETVVETSASRKSSETDEVGTHCESIISHLSEDCTDVESMNRSVAFRQIISQRPETSKRTLLMREAALQKRRKAAEDLLQWHQRLLEEERKIVELEMAANSVINQVPNLTIEKTNNTSNEYTFSGSQLNSLWLNMTGSEEKRFKDEETYLLSQVALERFCNVARIYTNKSKQKFIVNFSDINDIINTCVSDADSNNSVLTVSKSTSSIKEFTKKCDSIIEKSNDYTSQFESPEIEPATEPNSIKSNEPHVHTNILENEIDKSKSTLHEIMQNISNISDEISAIYKLSSVVNCVKETKSDCESEIVSERSSSRESSRETTVQLEIKKSLSELIKTQSPCQDISSLRNSTRPNNRNNDPENALESIQTEIKDKITNDENVLNSVESNREIVGSDAENSSMIDVEEISLDDHSKPKYSNEIINNKETVRDFKDIMENIEFITSKEFTGESFSELNSVDVNVENTDKIIIDENQTCKSSDVEICENFVQISYVENEREENEKKSNITDLRVISNGALEEDLNKISECLDGSRTQNSHTISEIITENSNFLEGSQHNVEMKISGKLDGIGNISEDNEELDSKNTSEHLKTTSKEIINGIEDSEELTNDSITEHLENTNKEIINGIEDISAYEELDNNSITEHLENTSKEIINGIDDISADNEELDNNSITEHLKNTSKEIIDKTNSIDVKKRVSEILADVSILREDKSPRLQDIYTTTYDVTSSDQPSETGSPDNDVISVTQLFGEEVELFKKQLAIEQEIKQLELQQKEQIPYLYMREIPNKPPPPYTPPVAQVVNSILPSNTEQIDTIISNIAGTLYDGYKSGTLLSLSIQSNVNNIDKDCFTFVFDLCKELAVEYQKRFIEDVKPSWMKLNKSVAKSKPLSKYELKSILSRKSKEILGFERSNTKKANEAKWSRKKRDHVDDLLVLESQAEESEWTNYDDEEAIVRNEVTNDIMNMLLVETADVTSKIFNKRNVY